MPSIANAALSSGVDVFNLVPMKTIVTPLLLATEFEMKKMLQTYQ